MFFYNYPHLVGGGKESKGLRAREENQRRAKKIRGAGGKEEKNFGGLSYFIPSWARGGWGGGKILLDTGRRSKYGEKNQI